MSGSTPRRRIRAVTTMIIAGLTALAVLAGCGGTGEDSVAPMPARDAVVTGGSGDAPVMEKGAPDPVSDGSVAAPGAPVVSPESTHLVRRATIAVQVEDIAGSADTVRRIALGSGGMVVAESFGGSVPDLGRNISATQYGTLTLSVPADRLDATLDELSKLGTVIARTSSSDDVKAQYLDTEARIATLRASIERLRVLMDRATEIGHIVSLETELSRRQADLESLQSQLDSLKQSIAMSPIMVQLTTDPDVVAAATEGGFLGGLEAGWSAFTASLKVLVTALGTVLPFALAAALVIVPVVWWLRRRRGTHPQPDPTTAGPMPSSAPTSPEAATPQNPVSPQG